MAEFCLMWLGEEQDPSIKLALLLLLSSGHTTFYRGEETVQTSILTVESTTSFFGLPIPNLTNGL